LRNHLIRLVSAIIFSPLLILPFAFGLLYRWSLKATAVVWLPLAYLLHGVFRKRDPVNWRVKDFMKGPLSMLLLAYSGCVIFFNALLPFVFRPNYLEATAWLKAKLVPEALMRYDLPAPTPSPSLQLAHLSIPARPSNASPSFQTLTVSPNPNRLSKP